MAGRTETWQAWCSIFLIPTHSHHSHHSQYHSHHKGDLADMVQFHLSLSSPFLWPNNTQVTSADSKYYKWLFSGFHNALLRSRLCFQRTFLWDSSLHKNGSNEEIVMAVIIKLNEPHFFEAQLFIGASIHAIWYMGVPKALVVKKTTKGNFLNPHCTMGY